MSYKTNSTTAYGAITDVLINNRGKGYTKVPGITTVTSSTGTGAILEASSKSIGKISKTTIENIGFDYPADRTLRPDTKIPQILRIEQLAGFSRVGVTSFGKNYSVPPKIVVVDGRTKKVIPDVAETSVFVDALYPKGVAKIEISELPLKRIFFAEVS